MALIPHARNTPSERAIYAGKALRISPHQRDFLLDFLQRAVDTQSLLFYKQACAEAIKVLTSGNRITDASFQTISAALKLESPVTSALMTTFLNAESKDSKFFATIRILGAKLSDPSISREQKLTWAFEAANASIGDRERFAQAFEAILNLKSIDTSLQQANHSTKSLIKLLREEKLSKVALHRAQQRLLDYCDNSSKERLKAQFTLAHTTDLLRLAKEAIAEEHATG